MSTAKKPSSKPLEKGIESAEAVVVAEDHKKPAETAKKARKKVFLDAAGNVRDPKKWVHSIVEVD